MTRTRLLLSCTLLLAFAASAADEAPAPFGIRMSAPKEKLTIAREVEPFLYVLTEVPKPHEAFQTYSARATPRAGVCFVKAFGRDVRTTATGSALRAEYSLVRAELEAVYGKPMSIDEVQPPAGSATESWMKGLVDNRRVLGSRWSADSGSTMKRGIRTIDLVAAARTESEGFLVIEYTFDNIETCEADLKKLAKKSSL